MRIYFKTLGCPKNEVDSRHAAQLLADAGCSLVARPEEADVVVVNTCGFVEAAKVESIGVLRAFVERRRAGQRVVAAGCLVQRCGDELAATLPELDELIGVEEWQRLPALLQSTPAGSNGHCTIALPMALPGATAARVARDIPGQMIPLAAGPSAYLKIQDGCSAPCAFCTIPSFKGPYRSKSIDRLVAEARALVGAGAHELVLVAQDTTAYGYDWGQRDRLPDLLTALVEGVPDLRWLRLMYAYPGHLTDRTIETMARHTEICHYLDMPLQHGHPATLARMRRPSDRVSRRNVERLRAAMPDVAIRTTFIVGYPGETDAEFEALLEFIAEHRFDRVGAFTFSPEPGTPAAELPDQIDEETKQERYARLMDLQQRISLERNRALVGQTLDVLVEGEAEAEPVERPERRGRGARRSGRRQRAQATGRAEEMSQRLLVGRSYRDAPEVDGLVFCRGAGKVGEMARARITQALEYDLVGDLVRNG
ncbi:MAG: 30S ribosomal protein S12 methylthiotransferase RimO [Chloroflexi bacterium]|nr:30S ribosomal protein S12 methylthiotransferase RimO [Chloroflexota bacterium]